MQCYIIADLIVIAQRATELDPQDGLGWYLLGRCHMAAQAHEQAYNAYKQVYEANVSINQSHKHNLWS